MARGSWPVGGGQCPPETLIRSPRAGIAGGRSVRFWEWVCLVIWLVARGPWVRGKSLVGGELSPVGGAPVSGSGRGVSGVVGASVSATGGSSGWHSGWIL